MKNNKLNIKVIAGSVREGRFNDKAAEWIAGELRKHDGIDVELLDLKHYEMPFFNSIETPSYKRKPYENPVVAKWTKKISEADAFVIVTPEYNHGTSGVLKNALDWVYQEWNNKPVAFVSYGSVGGARAVENLRLIAGELQMADIRESVLIPSNLFFPVLMGKAEAKDVFPELTPQAEKMIHQLLWWTKALKSARNEN